MPETPTATKLSEEQAVDLSKDALKTACVLQSALVVGRSAADLYKALQSSWNSIQTALLVSESGEWLAEGDEDTDCLEEWEPAESEDWSGVATALSSIENLSGANLPSGEVLPVPGSTQVEEDALMTKTAPLNLDMCAKSVVQAAGLLSFQSPSHDTLDKCLRRVQKLLAPIREFVAAVSALAKRIHDGSEKPSSRQQKTYQSYFPGENISGLVALLDQSPPR